MLDNPLLNKDLIEERRYQLDLAAEALKGNTLIVLPTGLGKTVIAALVAAERLRSRYWGKVLLLSPTRPLAIQHLDTFKRLLRIDAERFHLVTGALNPAKRLELWSGEGRVFSATPHVVWNDLVAGRLSLDDFVLLIFDEAHRAVGNYPYVKIAEVYTKSARDPLILGLTATPGSSAERVSEVLSSLKIDRVLTRSRDSPDVRPYLAPLRIRTVRVRLPQTYREALSLLRSEFEAKVSSLASRGLINLGREPTKVPLRTLLELQSRLAGSADPEPRSALAEVALAIKLRHLMSLITSQGPEPALGYLERISKAPRRGKSDRLLLELESIRKLSKLLREAPPHPKLNELQSIIERKLRKSAEARIIVFVNLRETAESVYRAVSKIPGARPAKFYGQANRGGEKGMSQSQQRRILEEFSKGDYNVLIATSVAEEGLDVPEVDLVVFYDPVPSEIRHIQRKGRTGRGRPGEVVALLTEGAEEGIFWRAVKREKTMPKVSAWPLTAFTEPADERESVAKPHEVVVKVDTRELQSPVVRELSMMPDVRLSVVRLEVGDFVVSDRVAVERKTTEDLASSLVDGRIFDQIARLREAYERPILVIEGRDPFRPAKRAVNPRSLMGLASTLALMGIPIIWTKTPEDTAQAIRLLARREQIEHRRRVAVRKAPTRSLREDMERVLASVPGVGIDTARKLLKHFGSLRAVFNAEPNQLVEVKGIGEKLGKFIAEFSKMRYEEGGNEEA